jgi:hypothetical protein
MVQALASAREPAGPISVPNTNQGVGGYKLQMQHFCVFDDL